MSFACFFACSAERYAVIDKAIVPYFRGLAYNDAHTVVDNESAPEFCGGMYLHARFMSCALRYGTR